MLHKSPKPWVQPPLCDSWIMFKIYLYKAPNKTPSIDCYWVGAVPNLNQKVKHCLAPLDGSDCFAERTSGPMLEEFGIPSNLGFT